MNGSPYNAHVGPPAALELHGVGMQRGARHIFERVDVAFHPGSLTVLVGPNGAGKSTLLGIASGDVEPTSGEVRLLGRPLAQWSPGDLARVRAVMPQDHHVNFSFSVEEIVEMGRVPHERDPQRDEQIVAESMAAADVTHMRTRDVQTLSGGEAARTAFARVLAQVTPVVFLDEPTAALDLRHQERVLRYARSLASAGACVIAVLHDLNLAAAHADRIVMLGGGGIVADGAPRDVLTAPTIEALYGQPVCVVEHPTRGVPLVVTVDDVPGQVPA